MVKIINSFHSWYEKGNVYPVIFDSYVGKYLCLNCGRYIETEDCEIVVDK